MGPTALPGAAVAALPAQRVYSNAADTRRSGWGATTLRHDPPEAKLKVQRDGRTSSSMFSAPTVGSTVAGSVVKVSLG